jgi:hypothetical protein
MQKRGYFDDKTIVFISHLGRFVLVLQFWLFCDCSLFFCMVVQFFFSIVLLTCKFHNHYTHKDYNNSMKTIGVTPPSLFKPRWFSR